MGSLSELVSAKAAQSISNILKSAIDERVFGKVSGTDVVNQMFKLQSWRYMKTFSNVATTARCLPECRLTFHGSEVIAGIKMDVLQSDGLKGKLAEVGDMTLQVFTDLAKDHGFVSVSSPG